MLESLCAICMFRLVHHVCVGIFFVFASVCSLTSPIQLLTATAGLQDNRPPKLRRRLQSIAAAPFSVGKKIAVGVYHSLCCCGPQFNVLVSKASQNHAMQCM